MSSLERRNITMAGRRTSMRLEAAMWDAIREIARREGITVDALCSKVNSGRTESSLTSSVRVYAVRYFRELAERLER